MEYTYFSIEGIHGFLGYLFIGRIPILQLKIACFKTEETKKYIFEHFEVKTSLDEIVKFMLEKNLNYTDSYHLTEVPRNSYQL